MRKLTIVFLLSLFSLLSLQCGLFDFPALEPPRVEQLFLGAGEVIIIENNPTNDPSVFLGFELYYRFYNYLTATSDIAAHGSAISAINQPTPSDLEQLGFRRVRTIATAGERQPFPMLPVPIGDRGIPFPITIDFTGIAADNENDNPRDRMARVVYLTKDIPLRRQVTDPDPPSEHLRKYKSFAYITNPHNLSIIDADINHIPVTNRVTLSLYIFAVGRYDRVHNIFSRPEWLGRIDFSQR
ncbi:MAG: hypothetical protein FWC36_04920 [Spirochaetes bacterium]|nr:hypothetical protein [Spirochaetota bacterium]